MLSTTVACSTMNHSTLHMYIHVHHIISILRMLPTYTYIYLTDPMYLYLYAH